MAGGAGCHFDRFQIELTALAEAREDGLQQRRYFPCRLALDRLAVFFLPRQRLLDGARATDRLIDGQQLPASFTELLEGFDLALRLAKLGRRGEAFANCLSIRLTGQTISTDRGPVGPAGGSGNPTCHSIP